MRARTRKALVDLSRVRWTASMDYAVGYSIPAVYSPPRYRDAQVSQTSPLVLPPGARIVAKYDESKPLFSALENEVAAEMSKIILGTRFRDSIAGYAFSQAALHEQMRPAMVQAHSVWPAESRDEYAERAKRELATTYERLMR